MARSTIGHWVLAFHCARCREASIAAVGRGGDTIVPVMSCEHCGTVYQYRRSSSSELVCWRAALGEIVVRIYPHWVGEEVIEC
jgi:predicted enzyme related to lactoylglutathione lyase